MRVLHESNVLSIEDILAFFPDFVVIDTFKSEICGSLDEYNRSLAILRADINEFMRSSADMHCEISRLNTDSFTIPINMYCAFSGSRLANSAFSYFTSGLAYCPYATSSYLTSYLKRTNKPDACFHLGDACPLTGDIMMTAVDAPLHAGYGTWDVG